MQRKPEAARIPGTKPSLHSGQTIVSSGIPSFDHIIDGGIPLGSLVVIEEDQYGDYARLVLSYFMSEAVYHQHPLLVTSLDTCPRKMTTELPAPADVPPAAAASAAAAADPRMAIAWRYQALPRAPTAVTGRFGQHYDLSRYVEQPVVDAAPVFTWGSKDAAQATEVDTSATGLSRSLHSLLLRAERHLSASTAPDLPASPAGDGPASATVRRLAVHCLGSPLWDSDPAQLIAAVHWLRALLRVTSSVAMVTVPTHLWMEAWVWRLRRAADICIGLSSFQGTPTASNPAFADYHGLVHVHRLSTRCLLAARYPRSADLAFKVRRKKFTIETLHLPPELGETVSRSQEEGETVRSQSRAAVRPAAGALCTRAARPGAAHLEF